MSWSDFLFPRICPVCGKRIPINASFCSCSDTPIRYVPNELFSISDNLTDDLCFAAPYYYDGIIRQLLLTLKFQNQPSLAKTLGLAMAAHASAVFSNVSFDCVTFVPMALDDLRERSFNQSALLAQTVAEKFFIQCSALLQKTHATPKQHTLSRDERFYNLENAFTVTDIFRPGMTVLLCDDIKTTGTTLRRCRDTLLDAGAKEVFCLACAMSDYDALSF